MRCWERSAPDPAEARHAGRRAARRRKDRATAAEAVRRVVRRNMLQNAMQNAPLQRLETRLGGLDQSARAGTLLDPSVNVVAQRLHPRRRSRPLQSASQSSSAGGMPNQSASASSVVMGGTGHVPGPPASGPTSLRSEKRLIRRGRKVWPLRANSKSWRMNDSICLTGPRARSRIAWRCGPLSG